MVGFLHPGSRKSQVLTRLAGAVCLALLLAGGSLFSLARPAHASGGEGYVDGATASNTFGDYTLLNDTNTNNNPNAHILVTATWDPGGTYTGFDNHPLGVWYDAPLGRWAIFNEDQAPMPVGADFDVFTQGCCVVQTATAANTSGYITTLDNAALNGNPSAHLLVTQNWNPGGGPLGVYNPHTIGVWYNPWVQQWTIYNEDKSALPLGASFNVAVDGDAMTLVATASNTVGDSTCTSAYTASWEELFITHVYSGYFTDVAALWWNADFANGQTEWCIFDGSGNAMPLGATFTVTFWV